MTGQVQTLAAKIAADFRHREHDAAYQQNSDRDTALVAYAFRRLANPSNEDSTTIFLGVSAVRTVREISGSAT